MQESLQSSQTEVKEVKDLQDKVAKQQEAIDVSLQPIEGELAELQRRGNLKFFGIKEHEHESDKDTEELLRNFLRNDLKIPREDEENIHFDRVHTILLHQASSNTQNLKPRPIRNLVKGCNLGIYNDFPKEVEEIRITLPWL